MNERMTQESADVSGFVFWGKCNRIFKSMLGQCKKYDVFCHKHEKRNWII